MTAEDFATQLAEIDEEGSSLIASAKKQAEQSTELQAELSQGVTILKAHYGQRIETLINDYVNQQNQ